MWIWSLVSRIALRLSPHGSPPVILLVISVCALLCGTACAGFDSSGWRLVRDIHVPDGHARGLAGIILESSIVEHCLPDLTDLRLTTTEGSLVPITVAEALDGRDAELIPARVFRVARKAGKWTDIWVDKSAKVLTRGIAIRTPSTDYTRKVEIRGADTSHEAYVIRVDGLILDRTYPPTVRCDSVFHPLNNFQYLQIRILDGEAPPLKVEGVSCYPPLPEASLRRRLPVRLIENRQDEASRSTVVVADLGAKRLPATVVSVDSPEREFVKKVRLFGASSPSPESWTVLNEGTVFRVRQGEAVAQDLEVRLKPTPLRYLKLEFSEGTAGQFTVDGITVQGSMRLVVFQPDAGSTYRLYYDNPNAPPMSYTNQPISFSVEKLAALSQETKIDPPRRNKVPIPSKPVAQPKSVVTAVFWKAVGVAMLLIGLLLLFSVMLKARSLRRRERQRTLR